MTTDSWTSRLYQSIKRYQPWPHFFKCTPALRHKPMATDDELTFINDMAYLQDLQSAILDDCRLARQEVGDDVFADFVGRPLLVASQIPVESQRFWQEFGEWPVDMAQHLLTMWRFDREMDAWMEHRHIDEAPAA